MRHGRVRFVEHRAVRRFDNVPRLRPQVTTRLEASGGREAPAQRRTLRGQDQGEGWGGAEGDEIGRGEKGSGPHQCEWCRVGRRSPDGRFG